MGIDHGLGGKDNTRSREKRAKRAERQSHKARNSLTMVKDKKVLVFNEEERTKHLTGFRQRKTERRKYGLAMQIVKEKKVLKDAVRVKRKANKEARGETDIVDPEWKKKQEQAKKGGRRGSDGRESESDSEVEDEEKEKTLQFEDAGTVGMFGAGVSVSVGVGIEEERDDLDDPDVAAGLERYRAKTASKTPKLTKMEKAVRKVQQSGALNKKKKRGADREGEAPARTVYGKHGKKQVLTKKADKKAQGANGLLSKVRGGGGKSFKGKGRK